jgi:long-chain fatty acid transport protein
VALALGAAALLATSAGEASPEDLFGNGARTSAMGATGTAHAQGSETAWHNPALASSIRQNALTIGYSGAVFGLGVSSGGVDERVSVAPAKGVSLGAALPIPFGGVLRDRIGASLSLYSPSDVIVRGRVLYPERLQYPLLPDRAQSLTLRAGLGVDIGWGVSVGVGVAALAELVGDVVTAADPTGRAGTRVEEQLVATYAPAFGAVFAVPGDSKLRIGAVFRGELDARFSVTVDGSKLSTLALPLFNIAGIAQYDPAQLAVEVARVDRSNVLAAQLVYKRWSRFPGILEPTVACSEGGPGACGLVPPVVDWRDTVAVRIGAEQAFELAPWVVLRARGGAFLETSALPSELPSSDAFDVGSKSLVRVPTRYLDTTRIALTSGVGVSLGRAPVDLDFFTQFHALVPRTLTSVDAVGGPMTELRASGFVKVFGLALGVKL